MELESDAAACARGRSSAATLIVRRDRERLRVHDRFCGMCAASNLGERAYMRDDAAAERRKVIAALETTDDAPARMALRDVADLLGKPGVVTLDEPHVADVVLTMRIEPRRHEDHLRLEFVEPGQPHHVDR